MKLTKERLQQIVHAAGLEPCDHEEVFYSITAGEIVMMARQLLGGMEQEPIATLNSMTSENGGLPYGTIQFLRMPTGEERPGLLKLYAAPQLPQPAVVITNEEIDSIVIPISPDGLDEEKYPIESHLHHDRERIRKALHEYACRAAILQGAEHSKIDMLCKVLKNAPLSPSDSQGRKKADVENGNQQFESLSGGNK